MRLGLPCTSRNRFAVGLEPRSLGAAHRRNALSSARTVFRVPHQREVAQSLVFRIAVPPAAFVPIESHAIVVVPHDRGNRVTLNPVDDLVWKRGIPTRSPRQYVFFAKHFRLGGRSESRVPRRDFNLFNTTNFFNRAAR